MAKKLKKLKKGYSEEGMPMKKMMKAPATTTPNSADAEINKLMSNKGYPRKKVK